MPGLSRRKAIARGAGAIVFKLTGSGPDISGLEHVPDGPCVIIANHASYLDGVIMNSILPPRFSFVIKHEMRSTPLAGLMLRRIDSFFVDRSSANKSATTARQILRAARDGRALGFFPEGTFTEEEGLRQFRLGAFVAAVSGQLPLVPVVIRGSRYKMPASRLLPRPKRLAVDIFPAIDDHLRATLSPRELERKARAVIVKHLDEPDLQAQSTLSSEPSLVNANAQ